MIDFAINAPQYDISLVLLQNRFKAYQTVYIRSYPLNILRVEDF